MPQVARGRNFHVRDIRMPVAHDRARMRKHVLVERERLAIAAGLGIDECERLLIRADRERELRAGRAMLLDRLGELGLGPAIRVHAPLRRRFRMQRVAEQIGLLRPCASDRLRALGVGERLVVVVRIDEDERAQMKRAHELVVGRARQRFEALHGFVEQRSCACRVAT